MNEKIKLVVRQMIAWLVAGDFESIVKMTQGVRMSSVEIKTAIQDYGRTLSIPPESAFGFMSSVEAQGTKVPQFSVHMPLWTREEGRSDLTMELTIKFPDEDTAVELDDIHVL